MSDRVTFQPVEVAVAGQTEGRLVYVDGKLAAVLIKLDCSQNELEGRWYAEAAFNSLERMSEDTFVDLQAVSEWIVARLTSPVPEVAANSADNDDQKEAQDKDRDESRNS